MGESLWIPVTHPFAGESATGLIWMMTMRKLAYDSASEEKAGTVYIHGKLGDSSLEEKAGTMYIPGKLGDSSSEEKAGTMYTYMESLVTHPQKKKQGPCTYT